MKYLKNYIVLVKWQTWNKFQNNLLDPNNTKRRRSLFTESSIEVKLSITSVPCLTSFGVNIDWKEQILQNPQRKISNQKLLF